jgi:hypothetical protein
MENLKKRPSPHKEGMIELKKITRPLAPQRQSYAVLAA